MQGDKLGWIAYSGLWSMQITPKPTRVGVYEGLSASGPRDLTQDAKFRIRAPDDHLF